MPGKSRHGKGKRYQISKQRNIPQPGPSAAAATPLTPAPEAVAPAVPAAPAPKAAAATAKAPVNLYAYIPGDLRRIGILTGIIIIILFVLYFILT